jgi:hypothetical protein
MFLAQALRARRHGRSLLRPRRASDFAGTGAGVRALHAVGGTWPLFIGLIALVVNIVVTFVVSVVLPKRGAMGQVTGAGCGSGLQDCRTFRPVGRQGETAAI